MFRFTTRVAYDPDIADGYMKHFIELPDETAAALTVGVRAKGTVDGHRFSRLVLDHGDLRVLRFGAGWFRDVGLADGDEVTVEVGVDPDPDAVDLPAELTAVFEEDPEAEYAWEPLTGGRKRTLVYPLDRAKRPETRERKAREIAAEAKRLAGF